MNNIHNKTRKILRLIRPYLKNEELNSAKFQGPICDSKGFSQHKGECWNDTLQEIFLFTDGLKEITQPLIYNLDTSRNNLSKLIRTRLYPNSVELNTIEQNTVDKLVKYITLMKVRFVEHYNFLITGYNKIKEPLTKKRRYSSLCGIGSAKHIINLYHGNSNIYRPGLSHLLRNELFLHLIRIFDVGYLVAPYKNDKISNINAVFISANIMNLEDTNTYRNSGGHAFGFLKCNSIWKLYDDNRSELIRVDEKLISLYINEDKVALGLDSDNNIFILKYNSNNGLFATIMQYYDTDKDEWINWSDTLYPFRIILTKNAVSIVRPRIRWTKKSGGQRRKN